MKDFGRWFADFQLPEPPFVETQLPEGVWETSDGEYEARCCVCDQFGPIYCELSEIPEVGYRHYCGRGPSCCP